MSVRLNHTIVAARDKDAAARFARDPGFSCAGISFLSGMLPLVVDTIFEIAP